ncbi:BglG family transcription antiterminator [Enterococcus sp. AZ163]|uniref:BglG family transcription antiterminator n=1 Tax=Enterococcus sp. AZ163 TaxID=2774638 RepID=UPI003D2C605B
MLQLREKKLIQLLMDKPLGEKQTSNALALELSVSSKTIKNDIKRINASFADKPYRIFTQKGQGIWLDYPTESVNELRLLSLVNNEDSTEEMEIRKRDILHVLLNTQEYLSVKCIAEQIFSSNSTVLRDLDALENYLASFNVSLIRAPRKGIKIEGDEIAFRILKAELLKQETAAEEMLLDFVDMQKTFPDVCVSEIKQLVLDFQKEFAIELSDIALKGLIIHIAISLQRLSHNQYVEMGQSELSKLEKQKEWSLAEKLYLRLVQHFELLYKQSEIGYLTIHLMGANLANQPFSAAAVLQQQPIDQELLVILKEWSQQIDQLFSASLAKDQRFLSALLLHLKPLLNRLSYGISIKNPWTKELKKKYPRAYEIAVAYAECIRNRYQLTLNEDEICYLVMHIESAIDRSSLVTAEPVTALIVCASGMGTSYLLKSKLEKEFPQLEIIGISSAVDPRLLHYQAELIISTVPLNIPDVKVVYVSPVLNEKERKAVQQNLNTKESSHLASLLSPSLVFLQSKMQTPEEVIRQGVNALEKDGYVTADFLELVLQRECLSSTAIGNLVAIPHAYQGSVVKQGIAVIQLEKSISWKNEQVQLVFVLAIDTNIQHLFADIFEELAAFTQDTARVNKVLQAKTKKEALALIMQ